MKITIYELLGMIKDGKTPKKIKYENVIYEYDNYKGDSGYVDMTQEPYKWFDHEIDCDVQAYLNYEVEILEEPKGIPEKLNTWYGIEPVKLDSPTTFKDNSKYIDFNTEMFFDKINEIIDYLESKGK